LCSLSDELVHYWQWLERDAFSERGVAVRARGMVRAVAADVAHPSRAQSGHAATTLAAPTDPLAAR